MTTCTSTKGAARRTSSNTGTMRSLPTGSRGDQSSALFPAGLRSLHSDQTSSVGGLRMAQDFTHQPVLLAEVVEAFRPVPSGVIVDATLGGAGHAAALLDSRPDLGILGMDRDPDAVDAARRRLAGFEERAVIHPGRFSQVASIVADARQQPIGRWPAFDSGTTEITGILADLGVSSHQLDLAERGFSFSADGPLDMRMDDSTGESAASLLDRLDLDSLTRLLREHGEGRYARRIARAILDARPITSTGELVDVVDRAVPKADRRRGHVASRTFQALRVEVNDEFAELDTLLAAALGLLAPAGRLVVISYHSGEDARVKHTMRRWADGDCVCPPGMPCVCGATSLGLLVSRRSIVASADELVANPRARSARLRAFEVAS